MPFLRHTLDIARATARPALQSDIVAIERLFSTSRYQHLNVSTSELGGLVTAAPAVVLEAEGAIWGAVVASWPVDGTAWMRGLALVDQLSIDRALERLVPALHEQARAFHISRLYYGGDIGSDMWLAPRLATFGYVHDTYVIIYTKRSMNEPSAGNPAIRIRNAEIVDLAAVAEIDRRCFEAQWVKDSTIIGAALINTPCFLVAEDQGRVIGYAYATSHYNGRQVHLVRIAVHPDWRGSAVGVRLLSEVVRFARKNGADTLTLNTQEYNTHARRLYEWFGFRRTGERQLILRCDLLP
jgi:ribosomal protein S18 acetylase RimI-like enzyme